MSSEINKNKNLKIKWF